MPRYGTKILLVNANQVWQTPEIKREIKTAIFWQSERFAKISFFLEIAGIERSFFMDIKCNQPVTKEQFYALAKTHEQKECPKCHSWHIWKEKKK